MPRDDFNIGIIGAGGIVRSTHMRAYTEAGLKVVAAADINPEALRAMEKDWGLKRGFTDYRKLLELKDVCVIDLTVPAWARPTIVADCAAAGKHILCQKPFAHSMADAKFMVEVCEKHGVKLAIQHNSRWVPGYLPIKRWLESGKIGTPYLVTLVDRSFVQLPAEHYAAKMDKLQILEMTVHYIDLIRHWFGTPLRVSAIITRDPTQTYAGEHVALINLEWEPPLIGHITDDWRCRGPFHSSHPVGELIHIEGTKGTICGTSEEMKLYAEEGQLGGVFRPEIRGHWFPDAFAGAMLELMRAIREGDEPLTSGRDNLGTIATVFAAYQSALEKRSVSPVEVLKAR